MCDVCRVDKIAGRRGTAANGKADRSRRSFRRESNREGLHQIVCRKGVRPRSDKPFGACLRGRMASSGVQQSALQYRRIRAPCPDQGRLQPLGPHPFGRLSLLGGRLGLAPFVAADFAGLLRLAELPLRAFERSAVLIPSHVWPWSPPSLVASIKRQCARARQSI
jgi:hypothetical protein